MALTLYHIAPSRGSMVLWMLEEIGQPYTVRLLDARAGENRQAAYLAINPMGKVPALDHDGIVIAEAAAICCHLADAFPQEHLAPAVGDPRRGPYLQWLFFGPGCLEPAVTDRAFPRQAAAPLGTLGWGSYDLVVEVLAGAVGPGPYLFGDAFTAADVVIGSGIRWGLFTKLLPERPEFLAYADRLAARPALQRATAKDREFAGQVRAS